MNGEKKDDWKDPEVEEYLSYARRLLVQTMDALPGAPAGAVAVVLEKILPPFYYWREEQRKAAGAPAGATSAPATNGAHTPATNGARAPQGATTAQAPPVKEDREAVLASLKWHPMRKGPGEWAFALNREGSPRPGLAPILEDLKAGRRLRVGGYEYELSEKFLHRFPVKP
ncbi:MAG: hypothetical protein ACP5QE_07690 [Conexivisphaera sp.]